MSDRASSTAAPPSEFQRLLRAATFITSAGRLTDLPPDRGAEVACAGRSNAGKSSTLNTLTDHGGLARVSKTPGRTQLLNVFLLGEGLRLVDLPGYGFARAPEAQRAAWARLCRSYLERRQSLAGVFVVMDARHPLQPQDREFLALCAQGRCAVHVLLNKADKLSRSQGLATLRETRAALARLLPGAGVQLFSAHSKLGLEQAHAQLAEWLVVDAGQEKAPGSGGIVGAKVVPGRGGRAE